jgi:hypothetical protein
MGVPEVICRALSGELNFRPAGVYLHPGLAHVIHAE